MVEMAKSTVASFQTRDGLLLSAEFICDMTPSDALPRTRFSKETCTYFVAAHEKTGCSVNEVQSISFCCTCDQTRVGHMGGGHQRFGKFSPSWIYGWVTAAAFQSQLQP